MATTPNYSWPTPDNTAYVKDGASAIRNLGNAIDSTTKTVSDAATAAQSTATTANTTANAAIPKATVTTKGDLIVATASATVARLGVGTDGQVLSADAASSGGVKWISLPTPAQGWTQITSGTTATGNALNLTSLSGYDRYLFVWQMTTTATSLLTARFNSNSSSIYTIAGQVSGNGNYQTTTSCFQTDLYTGTSMGYLALEIAGATSTTASKKYNLMGLTVNSGGTRATSAAQGIFASNTAITSINFTSAGTFSAGAYTLFGAN